MQFGGHKKAKTISLLQDSLAPNIQGIIWLTTGPLHQHPRPFDALDYFFEGVLTRGSKTPSLKKNLFFSQSFGQDFFLAQITKDQRSDKKVMQEVFDIVAGLQRGDDKILILEPMGGKSINNFTKMYPHYNFVVLYI